MEQSTYSSNHHNIIIKANIFKNIDSCGNPKDGGNDHKGHHEPTDTQNKWAFALHFVLVVTSNAIVKNLSGWGWNLDHDCSCVQESGRKPRCLCTFKKIGERHVFHALSKDLSLLRVAYMRRLEQIPLTWTFSHSREMSTMARDRLASPGGTAANYMLYNHIIWRYIAYWLGDNIVFIPHFSWY